MKLEEQSLADLGVVQNHLRSVVRIASHFPDGSVGYSEAEKREMEFEASVDAEIWRRIQNLRGT